MPSFSESISAFLRNKAGFLRGRGYQTIILAVVISATFLGAQNITLKYPDGRPIIALHTVLTYEGSGERLVATATNESGIPLQRAEICVMSPGMEKGCLFEMWNTSAWAPGAELKWNLTTSRKVSTLKHEAAIEEFKALAPQGPVIEPPAALAVPQAVSVAPMPQPKTTPNKKIAKLPNLQAGIVLDSQSAKTFITTGLTSQEHTTGTEIGSFSGTTFHGSTTGSYFGTGQATTTAATQIHNITLNEKQLLIVTPDFLYRVNDAVEKPVGFDLHGSLGRMITNHKHGCHVIINDPVQFSPDKGYLNVVDVDGKICHMEIDRQERIVPLGVPSKP